MPTEKMKILIVDDHQGMREMMRSFLPESFDEVCECDDGAGALDCYRAFLPDWVLMDWEMKRMDGLTATRGIINSFPTARILMVSQYCDKELRSTASEAGVSGFFPKDNLLNLRDFFKNQQLSNA
jgi:NarL family two-component system response regulator LiaR